MSQLFQGMGCPIRISNGGAITHYHNGLPYVFHPDGSLLACENVGAPAFYHQGIPYAAAGRIASTLGGGVVTRIAPGGAPYDSFNRIVMSSTAVGLHFSGGVCYNEDNNLFTVIIA